MKPTSGLLQTPLFVTNEHSDGYTIHHCLSPTTLHHARQPPTHLSAKWLASLWLSAAAVMIIDFTAALLFFAHLISPCPVSHQNAATCTGSNLQIHHHKRERASVEHDGSCPTRGTDVVTHTHRPPQRENSDFTLSHLTGSIFHSSVSTQPLWHRLALSQLFATWGWVTKSSIRKRGWSGRERR